MITEATIKSTIKKALTSGKRSTELKDGGERGGGRLALIIRIKESSGDGSATKTAVTEWYAVWHRGGKRRMAKIGSYPRVPLADARKAFRDNFVKHIELGQDPTGPRARRAASTDDTSVKALFQAYVAKLYADGAASARTVERALLGPKGDGGAAAAIGPDLNASDVTADDITPYLRAKYHGGAKSSANFVFGAVSAAFSFGMRSANDFRQAAPSLSGGAKWKIKAHPLAGIPSEKPTRGRRHLQPAEFAAFWKWLETKDDRSQAPAAIRTLMACGQRITEILRVGSVEQGVADYYDTKEQVIYWEKTKNSNPHAIPVPRQAAQILAEIPVNKFGLYFPGGRNPKVRMTAGAIQRYVNKYIAETGAKPFTARDLRRTWRTLSGQAGLSHDIRGRIQNHALGDIGSLSYDRWSYMPEKRAAMKQWSKFLDSILTGKFIQHVPEDQSDSHDDQDGDD